MPNLTKENYYRIHNTVNFMREATAIIDSEKTLLDHGIIDIERFSEEQLMHLFITTGIKNPKIKQLFDILTLISLEDIRFLNGNNALFNKFILISGGLYYARSIRRLIKKSDITIVKDLLGAQIYQFVFEFARSQDSLEDYPLTEDFEAHIYAIGFYIFNHFIEQFDPIIKEFLYPKIDLSEPKKSTQHLRISNEYALNLAIITQKYIIDHLME